MEDTKKQDIETLAWEVFQDRTGLRFKRELTPEQMKSITDVEDYQRYRDEADRLYEKRVKKKLKALNNKKYPEIEVPASGNRRWGGGAYTLCFVYSKYKGNVVLKGYYQEVQEYLKKNYTHYYCNFSLWYHGGNRDIWSFWKDGIGIFEPTNTRKRDKWEIRPYTCGYKDTSLEDSNKKALYFKRLPKRWIPEFDKL